MKLLVRVIEARNLPAVDPNGFSDPYVKLQLGRQRYRSKVIKKCLNSSGCPFLGFLKPRTIPLALFGSCSLRMKRPKIKIVLHLRYRVEDLPSRSVGCNVQVYIGITWLKYTRYQNRITKNIMSNFQDGLKIMLSVLDKEYISGTEIADWKEQIFLVHTVDYSRFCGRRLQPLNLT